MKKAKELAEYLRSLKREKLFTDLTGKVHRRVCITEDIADEIASLLEGLEKVSAPKSKAATVKDSG